MWGHQKIIYRGDCLKKRGGGGGGGGLVRVADLGWGLDRKEQGDVFFLVGGRGDAPIHTMRLF